MMLLILFLLILAIFFTGIYLKQRLVTYISLGVLFMIAAYVIYNMFFLKRQMFAFTDDQTYIDEGKIDVYCGDGANLPDDYDALGSRHQCLKKGIGIGMGMSSDDVSKVTTRAPSVQRSERTYCGSSETLPDGYNRFATRHECMKKGVGIGARMPADKRRQFRWKAPKAMSKHEIYGLAHRFKIPTNQTRKRVLEQIAEQIVI
jgi:hypothetical protein